MCILSLIIAVCLSSQSCDNNISSGSEHSIVTSDTRCLKTKLVNQVKELHLDSYELHLVKRIILVILKISKLKVCCANKYYYY